MGDLRILSWQDLEKFIIAQGCEFKRQKGSHRIYKKEGVIKLITIPAHKEVSRGVILSTLRIINSNKDDLDNFFV
jgi:predicted RNA binding protein YcfA (HicA-like mRNA interferase family)